MILGELQSGRKLLQKALRALEELQRARAARAARADVECSRGAVEGWRSYIGF